MGRRAGHVKGAVSGLESNKGGGLMTEWFLVLAGVVLLVVVGATLFLVLLVLQAVNVLGS